MSKYLKIFFFILAIGLVWQDIRHDTHPWFPNLHILEAQAFLKGHISFDHYIWETAEYKGRFYLVNAPFPAIMFMPIVALFGVTKKATFVSLILTLLNVILVKRIAEKLKIEQDHIPWLIVAFFLGTGYWMCLYHAGFYVYYSHIAAITCLLLGINESMGKGRGLLAGLFIGMAFLSRQMCIFSSLFVVMLLWKNQNYIEAEKERRVNVIKFAVVLGSCIVIYLVYNWVRFDHILDTGYSHIKYKGYIGKRVKKFGLFHYSYVLYNFIYMFVQGFHIKFSPPLYLQPQVDQFGTSLTFASPFLFAAFWAKWKRSLLWSAWISISIILICSLFYHNNGWSQENAQRFSLDFLPILLPLVAIGFAKIPEKLWKVATIYSVTLNALILYGSKWGFLTYLGVH